MATRFSPGAEHQASVVSKNVGGLASWSAAHANSPNAGGWIRPGGQNSSGRERAILTPPFSKEQCLLEA